MDDHQLLRAYAEGDELAFETLVEKYLRMVYAVAARQTGDSHLAEEIAQSVFLILSRKARRLSARTSIPGWLLRTTRFVCWDAIKMRRRREENERKVAQNVADQVDAKRDSGSLELLLDEAIQALRPDEQAGIVARFFEGKTFQEIAEMFAITEEAARKRTSRCLAKLQTFMAKRCARVSLEALSGLLATRIPRESLDHALQQALSATQAARKGNAVGGNAVSLANHAMQVLRMRFLGGLTAKLLLPLLLICVAAWSIEELNRPVAYRIEKLGKAWGALDQRIAQHRQFMAQTPPTAANYQTRVQEELGAISRPSTRIIDGVTPMLAGSDAGNFAAFLTAELSETLKLDAGEKQRVFAYVQGRLANGATFKDAMKGVAEATESEARDIKAMLSPAQQQSFDQIYGADGVLLFSYAKAVGLGRIGN